MMRDWIHLPPQIPECLFVSSYKIPRNIIKMVLWNIELFCWKRVYLLQVNIVLLFPATFGLDYAYVILFPSQFLSVLSILIQS